MATSRQVKCINKTDRFSRHERISHIGGDWGKEDEATVIHHIENDIYSYHVKVGYNDVKVIVSSYSGRKYLKTEADTTTRDNLLNLPECG